MYETGKLLKVGKPALRVASLHVAETLFSCSFFTLLSQRLVPAFGIPTVMYCIFYPVEYKQHSYEQLCSTEIGSKQKNQWGQLLLSCFVVVLFAVFWIVIVLMPFRIWIGIKNDANPHADPAQVLYMLENQNFFQFSGTFTTEPFHIDYPDRQRQRLLCVLDLLIRTVPDPGK